MQSLHIHKKIAKETSVSALNRLIRMGLELTEEEPQERTPRAKLNLTVKYVTGSGARTNLLKPHTL